MNRPPSTVPRKNLAKENSQMFLAKAIRTKHSNTIGASARIVGFRPIASFKRAAKSAPGGAPIKGITAHQAPSVGVVGMSVEFSNTGRYGEVHAKLTPDAITENVAKINKNT